MVGVKRYTLVRREWESEGSVPNAVEEMRVGPSKPACRSWLQTRQCCRGCKATVVSDCRKIGPKRPEGES